MQPETVELVEHQPGQPGDGQPVVDPALSWQVHGGDGEDDAWQECQQEKGGVEGILWMTREGVSEGDGGDPVLGCEGKRSLSAHSPDAEKLSHRVEHHLLLFHHPRRQG